MFIQIKPLIYWLEDETEEDYGQEVTMQGVMLSKSDAAEYVAKHFLNEVLECHDENDWPYTFLIRDVITDEVFKAVVNMSLSPVFHCSNLVENYEG